MSYYPMTIVLRVACPDCRAPIGEWCPKDAEQPNRLVCYARQEKAQPEFDAEYALLKTDDINDEVTVQ